jgi:hypothetical protein
MNLAELIPLRPHGPVAVRYGRTEPDADGIILELLRLEFDTDRGPFGLELPVENVIELIDMLRAAVEAVPAERAAWAQRNRN